MKTNKSNGYIVLVGVIALLTGAFGILYSLMNFRNYVKTLETYEVASATIIDIYDHKQYTNGLRLKSYKTYEFRYMIDDVLYKNTHSLDNNKYDIGEKIEVFYLEKEPETSYIMEYNLSLYTIVGVCGLVFFFCGIAIVVVGMNENQVYVFQDNRNIDIDYSDFNNERWREKIKEERDREINNNKRVMSLINEPKENFFEQKEERSEEKRHYYAGID